MIAVLLIFISCSSGGCKSVVDKIPAILIPKFGSKEIVRGDNSKNQVIFTFDAGASMQSADEVLEVLAKHHVKGTFFFTGKSILKFPDLVKKIVSSGNEIFNHTYDHFHLTELSDDRIKSELSGVEKILSDEKIIISTKPYFRAPYGDRNSRVLSLASEAGYESVYWTVDALDWKESEGETADKVKERIVSTLAPGNIYLMHLGDSITGKILDDVFSTIESKGYKIVSLTQGI
jgi:peptidoglycan/xylan/chitin deacetylase (PgdA/CDA1 family)